MIDLEIPRKLRPLVTQAHLIAANVFRPVSRKYDAAEHAYPVELDMVAALLDGMASAGSATTVNELSNAPEGKRKPGFVNQAAVLGMTELCWGDVGLALSLPRQGLGNAAVAAVASPEQKRAFAGRWIAMAITEPAAGSDSAAIRTTARRDGDEWVLNGEKIFVTAGERCDAVVVWASLDLQLGRAAIKPFLVPKSAPGIRVARLEHKLGIRASDTATIVLDECRIPADHILGNPEIDTSKSFAGVMKTFDNTRPVVAAMAVGVARAAIERARELLAFDDPSVRDPRPGPRASHAAHVLADLEAELEAARLLTLRAAWMADRGQPNSLEASMAKAKAGRMVAEVTLRCVELCGAAGYAEGELLEKWARDAKILDIFEGTQQIQLLIVARRLLGKSSSDLR
jgi:acyl-CoA dehydrogenase